MADLINSLIKHCKADGALAAVLSTRIDFDLPAGGTLPAMAIVPITDARGPVFANTRRVSFNVDSAPSNRAACETVRQRLGELFHDKAGYTISSGADSILILGSESAGGTGPEKGNDDGPWQYSEFYIFRFADSF